MNQISEDVAAARLTEAVALECGVHPVVAKQIRTAAALHDIGKVKLPGSILNKPGKLNRQEFEVIKTHTTLGAGLLGSVQGCLGEMARMIALYHHEWYDGHGYWGRHTDELPAYISIAAIADVFTALVSIRPYKYAWPREEALMYIQNQSGTQFSPALVRAFLTIAREERVPKILEVM